MLGRDQLGEVQVARVEVPEALTLARRAGRRNVDLDPVRLLVGRVLRDTRFLVEEVEDGEVQLQPAAAAELERVLDVQVRLRELVCPPIAATARTSINVTPRRAIVLGRIIGGILLGIATGMMNRELP